jgi:hypothetical protein
MRALFTLYSDKTGFMEARISHGWTEGDKCADILDVAHAIPELDEKGGI